MSESPSVGVSAGGVGLAVSVGVVLLTLAFPLLVRVCKRGKGARKTAERGDRRNVVVVGPCGGGKSALFHKLVYGRFFETVSSAAVTRAPIAYPLSPQGGFEKEAATRGELVEVPGHASMLVDLRRELEKAKAVLVVVDGTWDDAQLRRAGSILSEVLTSASFADSEGGLCVVSTHSDAGRFRPLDAVEAGLDAELERLKGSRERVREHGDGEGAGAERNIVLGREGERFSLRKHAGREVDFVATAVAPERDAKEKDHGVKHLVQWLNDAVLH